MQLTSQMTRALRWLLAALCLAGATQASADTRRLGLTSFERVDIEGDMAVSIVASYRVGAQAEGSRDALEVLTMEVRERTLYIRRRTEGPYGQISANAGPLRITLTAQNLAGVWVRGAAQVSVSGLRGSETYATMEGAGTLAIAAIDSRALRVRMQGAGSLTLAGRAESLLAVVAGSGNVDGQALAVGALDVRSSGTGRSNFAAVRTAEITAIGAASVDVSGTPRCTVRNQGSGVVACGPDARTRLPRSEDED